MLSIYKALNSIVNIRISKKGRCFKRLTIFKDQLSIVTRIVAELRRKYINNALENLQLPPHRTNQPLLMYGSFFIMEKNLNLDFPPDTTYIGCFVGTVSLYSPR